MLEDVTVLDLSSVGPGPRCTWILADLGARVTRVVAPPGAGRLEPPPHAYGGGRGVRRVELDLRREPERVLELAWECDVVVESFRPGVADRLGVGFEAVRARNPRVVYAAITGYGQRGPAAGWAGHDLDYLALAGYLSVQSPRSDGGPPLPGATVADSAGGGMHAAISILAALHRRERTGEGAYLDVATTDGVLFLMALHIDEYLATGEEPAPGTTLLTGRYACYDLYRCADDRWVAVAAIEPRFFANLCRALGCEDYSASQYDDARQDEIRAILAAAFATRPRDEWVEVLAPLDTCVAPVLSVAEVALHPYVVERGLVGRAPDGRTALLRPLIAGAGRQ